MLMHDPDSGKKKRRWELRVLHCVLMERSDQLVAISSKDKEIKGTYWPPTVAYAPCTQSAATFLCTFIISCSPP